MLPHDSTPPLTKCCSTCKERKPLDCFYRDNHNHKDGRASYCKSCNLLSVKRYAAAHPPKKRVRIPNREVQHRADKKYRELHKEKVAAKDKAQKAKNHDRILEQLRARRKDNREHWNEVVRKWRATENGQLSTRATVHKRRKAPGTLTQKDIDRQYKSQHGTCYYCQKKVGKQYHVEHVIPITRGGTNDPSNVVIACKSCNSRKHDKLPHEWPEGGRLC